MNFKREKMMIFLPLPLQWRISYSVSYRRPFHTMDCIGNGSWLCAPSDANNDLVLTLAARSSPPPGHTAVPVRVPRALPVLTYILRCRALALAQCRSFATGESPVCVCVRAAVSHTVCCDTHASNSCGRLYCWHSIGLCRVGAPHTLAALASLPSLPSLPMCPSLAARIASRASEQH